MSTYLNDDIDVMQQATGLLGPPVAIDERRGWISLPCLLFARHQSFHVGLLFETMGASIEKLPVMMSNIPDKFPNKKNHL